MTVFRTTLLFVLLFIGAYLLRLALHSDESATNTPVSTSSQESYRSAAPVSTPNEAEKPAASPSF